MLLHITIHVNYLYLYRPAHIRNT